MTAGFFCMCALKVDDLQPPCGYHKPHLWLPGASFILHIVNSRNNPPKATFAVADPHCYLNQEKEQSTDRRMLQDDSDKNGNPLHDWNGQILTEEWQNGAKSPQGFTQRHVGRSKVNWEMVHWFVDAQVTVIIGRVHKHAIPTM